MPLIICVGLLIVRCRFQISKMNHNFILNNDFSILKALWICTWIWGLVAPHPWLDVYEMLSFFQKTLSPTSRITFLSGWPNNQRKFFQSAWVDVLDVASSIKNVTPLPFEQNTLPKQNIMPKGEIFLRCTTQDKKNIALITIFFKFIFWSL